jgi:hypothetical protein
MQDCYSVTEKTRIEERRPLVMPATSVEEIYDQHIKPLSPSERLQLLALTARELALQAGQREAEPQHSIMELHGLGAEIWRGVDPQDYVNELRKEWDHRP